MEDKHHITVTGANKNHKLVSATQTITVDVQQHKTYSLHRRQRLS